jgi:hypothetical protein
MMKSAGYNNETYHTRGNGKSAISVDFSYSPYSSTFLSLNITYNDPSQMEAEILRSWLKREGWQEHSSPELVPSWYERDILGRIYPTSFSRRYSYWYTNDKYPNRRIEVGNSWLELMDGTNSKTVSDEVDKYKQAKEDAAKAREQGRKSSIMNQW